MSAAQLAPFTLTPPIDQSRCGFPGCLGKAFHEGEHEFAKAEIPQPASGSPQHGWMTHSWLNSTEHRQTESAREIATQQFLAQHKPQEILIPLACSCAQRRYPHELAVHTKLRSESFNPEFRNRWPWSLMLSSRVEPSTEREAA